ncbi:hypothetical protein BJ170DRAFT_586747 [Xylariales sp. AK1849]|nr:hypothetical protein BJ170DRAFT_586747 [Xylariales sp. AK1849]
MLIPTCLNPNSYFYPIGNTPAISIIQSLPPQTAGNILLLGCGDVRNILFTNHMDGSRLDFTCCDIQQAVIARNIIILSPVIDDEEGRNQDSIWKIQFHMYLDQQARDLLALQTKKLLDASRTTEAWQTSKYGTGFSFCSMSTMKDVRKMWEFYKEGTSTEHARSLKHFKAMMNGARDHRARRFGDATFNLTALRSTKPALLTPSLLEDLNALCKHYWKHGSIELNSQARAKQNWPNATLLTLEDEATLHYGTDPLLGFHLATAVVPVTLQTPVTKTKQGSSHMEKLVATVKLEFSDWAESLRENQDNITLRFFVGDAMSFCHTLQHRRVSGSETAGWYRRPNRFDPVILDGPDYVSSKAPLVFDIIDTSNLCDHLGPLSLLVATSPLLSHRLTSALYTEVLASIHTHKDLLGGIVCGHVPTMSTLLGLFPVEYWTNTSTLSSGEEGLFKMIKGKSQTYVRTCWKRPAGASRPESYSHELVPVECDPKELAGVMFKAYTNMFRDEDYAQKLANLDIDAIKKSDIVFYQRSNFVSLLRLVKTRVNCDWESAMQSLLTMIELRQNAPMDRHYIQELYLFLHELDSLFKPFTSRIQPENEQWGDVRDWKNIPPVVCVTLKVPRKKVSVLTRMSREELGTPTVHCILQGPNPFNGWQNLFRSCQLAFGEVSTSGTRFQDSFSISVAEDGAGWKGSAPLLASFYVPSHVLFLEPRKATAGFGIHSTFASSRFVSELGLNLTVYETTLGNLTNVFITRYAPNQKCFPIVPGFAKSDLVPHNVAKSRISLHAKADPTGGHVINFTGRLDITSDEHKLSLQSGNAVQKTMSSPFQVAITIGNTTPLTVNFPVPIVKHNQRIRIARKSSYIEVIARAAGPSEWVQYPEFMFPVTYSTNEPITQANRSLSQTTYDKV